MPISKSQLIANMRKLGYGAITLYPAWLDEHNKRVYRIRFCFPHACIYSYRRGTLAELNARYGTRRSEE